MQSQSQDAVARAQRIVELREQDTEAAASAIPSSNALTLVDLVCQTPILASRVVEASLGVTRPTALKLLRQLEAVGVLQASGSGPRGQRRYLAHELMSAVTRDTATDSRNSGRRSTRRL